jgi:hypothetical protein
MVARDCLVQFQLSRWIRSEHSCVSLFTFNSSFLIHTPHCLRHKIITMSYRFVRNACADSSLPTMPKQHSQPSESKSDYMHRCRCYHQEKFKQVLDADLLDLYKLRYDVHSLYKRWLKDKVTHPTRSQFVSFVRTSFEPEKLDTYDCIAGSHWEWADGLYPKEANKGAGEEFIMSSTRLTRSSSVSPTKATRTTTARPKQDRKVSKVIEDLEQVAARTGTEFSATGGSKCKTCKVRWKKDHCCFDGGMHIFAALFFQLSCTYSHVSNC